jgi:3-hydroxybutyryl-CoA dehydrogenase
VEAIKTVTLVGAGKMGVQISVRAATFGFPVRVFDISAEALQSAADRIRSDIEAYFEDGIGKENPTNVFERVSFHENLEEAVRDTDLIIEAVPERLELKREVFAELDRIAAEHVILATNTSSIPASKIEEAVKGQDRVVNIHFYTAYRRVESLVDIMRGTRTSDEAFHRSKTWIEAIGCVPLVVKKECMGFVFNRIWRAVKRECLRSWAEGYADFKDIDRAWKLWTGMVSGPFGMMDFVGLDVVYDIEMSYYLESKDPKDKPPEALKEMVERGELGMKSGKGFYDWSDPEFLKPEFTQPRQKP